MQRAMQYSTCHPLVIPQTSKNHVIIYAIHVTGRPVLPLPVLGAPAGPAARAAGAVGGAAAGGAGAFQGGPRELSAVAITAREAAVLPHGAAATAICGDARAVAVGFADGCLLALSWSAKVRGPRPGRRTSYKRARVCQDKQTLPFAATVGAAPPLAHGPQGRAAARLPAVLSFFARIVSGPSPFLHSCARRRALTQLKSELLDPLGEALDTFDELAGLNDSPAPPQPQPPQQQQEEAQGGAAAAAAAPRRPGVSRLDFAPGLGLLAAVLDDGSVAVCHTAEESLLALEALEFSHWLVGPEARCGALGAVRAC
jgi:hypothetical protein